MRKQANQDSAMRYAAQFRLQANACLYLARKATEFWTAASLVERAEELLARANRIETSPARVVARRRLRHAG
jgi:hypothetical protein